MEGGLNNPMYSSFISAVSRHGFENGGGQYGGGNGNGPLLLLQGQQGIQGIQGIQGQGIQGQSGGQYSPQFQEGPQIPVDLVSQMQKDASQFVKDVEIKQTTPFFTSYNMIFVSGFVFFVTSFLIMNGMKLVVTVDNEKRYVKMFFLSLLLAVLLMGLQYMYKRVNY